MRKLEGQRNEPVTNDEKESLQHLMECVWRFFTLAERDSLLPWQGRGQGDDLPLFIPLTPDRPRTFILSLCQGEAERGARVDRVYISKHICDNSTSIQRLATR